MKPPKKERCVRPWFLASGAVSLVTAFAGLCFWALREEPPVAASMPGTRSENLQEPSIAVARSHSALALPAVRDETPLRTNDVTAALCDPRVPLGERRQLAFDLARKGTQESFNGLQAALKLGEPYLKAAIAEALGESPHPDAPGLLVTLLKEADEITARGAARGLAMRSDPAAVSALTEVLFDPAKPESVRSEAALALGTIQHPDGLASLVRASEELNGDEVAESVLDGLARRPFSETEVFFSRLLETAGQSGADKIMILEALAETDGRAASLLLKYVSDPSPEVRAAAVWALNTADGDLPIGPPLVSALARENDPGVRQRLFEVLSGCRGYDYGAVLSLARAESSPAAQVAAYAWLASASRSGFEEAKPFFDNSAVPVLKGLALNDPDAERRLACVLALRSADSAPAAAALQEIAGQSADRRVVDAAKLTRPRGGNQ